MRRIAFPLIGLVVLAALAWLLANELGDEPPDPDLRTRLASSGNGIPDNENISVGILGLNAPSGANFLSYGAEVAALYKQGASQDEIQKKIHSPKELRPTVTSSQTACWVDPRNYPANGGCLSFEIASVVLDQNRELLSRYKALYNLRHYANVGDNEATFLELTKLAIAEMRLEMQEHHYEAAYTEWRDQFRLLRNYLYGRDTWRGKAVGLVAIGMNIPVIDSILFEKPKIARSHSAELIELLRSNGLDSFNPGGMMLAEYLEIDDLLDDRNHRIARDGDKIDRLAAEFGQKNRIRNRYVRYSREYLRALREPLGNLPEAVRRVGEEQIYSFGWASVVDPIGSLFLKRHVRWQLENPEFFRHMYVVIGRLRLTSLLAQIVRDKIRDGEINAFLAKAGPQFNDPLSGNPMRWDSERRRVYFPDPRNECGSVFVRIPPLKSRSRPQRPARASPGNC